ncbi:hypothetical protein, partial [Sphingomonas segetis]|uniref:hypothetical protein n=1 Tax=Sphingomonas segetis TaxID=1104779 RepID=UPI0012D2B6E6
MTLGQEVTRGHLPLAANLLALAFQVLLARLTVEAKLLAVGHPAVDLLHPVRLDPLALDNALLLGAVRTSLLALRRASLDALGALRPCLMAIGDACLRAFHPVGTRLVAIRPGSTR